MAVDLTTLSPQARTARALRVLTCALSFTALLAMAAGVGFITVFRKFNMYDDEGFVMMTVRLFLDGWPLYDEVVSPYGPFYYLLQFLIHRVLGVPLAHDTVRLLALGNWLAMAALCAGFTLLVARRASLAALVFALVFFLLDTVQFEPGHPQELCGLAIGVVLVLAAAANGARSAVVLAAVSGVLAAGLVLTKINVGAFLASALLLAFLTATARSRLVFAAWAGFACAVLLLPFAVTRPNLALPWVRNYALLVSLSVVPMLVVGRAQSDGRNRGEEGLAADRGSGGLRLTHSLVYLLACAGGAAAIIEFALARGTTVANLIAVLYVLPKRIVSAMLKPAPVRFEGVVWAVVSILLAVLHTIRLRRRGGDGESENGEGGESGERLDWPHAAVAAGLKLTFAALTFAGAYRYASTFLLNFSVPLLWLVLTPYPAAQRGGMGARVGRYVLAFVAVLQALQAYPLPGSQIRFGLFLTIVAAAVCAADALAWLASARPEPERGFRAWTRRLEYPVVFVLLALVFLHRLQLVLAPYRAAVPIGMPGARLVRDSEESAATIQCLVSSLRANADTFISTTGFNSLYFWTGESPPTRIPIGNSVDGPEELQEAIAIGLARFPRGCVLTHENFFQMPAPAASPLLAAIRDGYTTCGRVNGFELKVRNGRPLPSLVDCAWEEPADEREGEGEGGSILVLNLAPMAAGRVDRVSVHELNAAGARVVADSRAPAGETALEILDDDARPVDAHTAGGIDLSAPRRLRLRLRLPPGAQMGHHGFPVVRLFDAQGRRLKSLPFLEPAGK